MYNKNLFENNFCGFFGERAVLGTQFEEINRIRRSFHHKYEACSPFVPIEYLSSTFKNSFPTTIVCIQSETDLDDAVRVFRRPNMHHEFQRYISAIFRLGEVRYPGAGNLFDHARSAVFPSMP